MVVMEFAWVCYLFGQNESEEKLMNANFCVKLITVDIIY